MVGYGMVWVLTVDGCSLQMGAKHPSVEKKKPIYSKHPYHTITYHTKPYHTITYYHKLWGVVHSGMNTLRSIHETNHGG